MNLPAPSSCSRKILTLLLATVVGVLASTRTVPAQSEFHAAAITRVAVDPANRTLVTASEDKTVRIWQLSTGKLLRTIRAPSGTGEHGKIYALAISPDGRTIAFAGYTGQKNRRVVEDRTYFDYEVYVHDLTSGKRLRTLTVPSVVDDLRWSPSGRFLLATTSEFPLLTIDINSVDVLSGALHVFSAPEYTEVAAALSRIYPAAVSAYDRDGRLLVIGGGGEVRAGILDTDFREVASRRFDRNPAAASVSPDGSMFAVTTLFSELSVHSTTDLSALYQRDFRADLPPRLPPVTSAEYSAVAWSADGRSLYFAGRATCSEHGCAIRKWDSSNWTSYKDINVSSHRVTHLAPLSGGGVAFGTAGPGFGVVDSNDRRSLYREPPPAVQTQQRPEAQEKPPARAAGEFWAQCEFPGPDVWKTGRLDTVRGKYLYIDRSGAAVLAPPFDFADDFSEGLARVRLGDKYGYIDRSGWLAIPVQFQDARRFSGGRAAVRSGDPIGYIDTTGRMVIPARYSDVGAFSEGLAFVRDYGESYFGYINVRGETIIPPKFDAPGAFRDGLASVWINHKQGYIDTRGELVTPANRAPVDQVAPTTGPLVPVRTADGTWGYADTRGTLIVPGRYAAAAPFSEGRSQVLSGGLWGYVDEKGDEVIPPRFHRSMAFSEGVASVCVSAEQLVTVPVSTMPPESVIAPIRRAGDVPIPEPRPFELGEADQRQVDALHGRVEALFQERQYGAALAVAREALETVELRLPRDHPAVIQSLWDLGRIQHVLGNYRGFVGDRAHALGTWRDARSLLERALQLVERSKGANHVDVGALTNALSDLLAALSEFDLALDMKQRELAVARANGGARSLPASTAANDLELLRVEKLIAPEYGKELSRALPMALAQVRHAEANLGADHLNVARGLSTVALIYGSSMVGVRGGAIGLYERALSLYGNAGTDDRQQALKARVALARLYADAHQYAQAERQLDLVAASVEGVLGRDDPAVVQLWLDRGFALRESGRFEAAAGFFTRALQFWDERLATEPSSIQDVRRTLEPLADTWRFGREYSRAEPLYRRLLETRDQHFALNWSVVARVMRKLGTTQRLRGDLTAARKTFEEVVALLEPHRPPASGNVWSVADDITRQALQELAALAVASNDLSAARDYLRHAGLLDDRIFWYFAGSERDILDESRDRSRSQFYHQALTITARYLKGDREWVGRAYDLVLDRKQIALDLQLRGNDAAGPLPERTRRSLKELATVRSDLARLMVRGPESTTSAEYVETVTLLFERAVALEKEVARIGPWNLAQLRPRVTATDVTARLPGETALIEFVRVRDEDPAGADSDAPTEEHAKYLAFVLTAGTISLVDMGPARAIDVLAGNLQAAVRLGADASVTSDRLRELHRLVWAPIEGLLGDSRQIVVSPDGELHRVPFAALLGEGDRFLIERFRFAYVGSGRDLATSRRERATPALDLALVADPDFGAAGPYPPLPGTAIEAERIPPLVQGNRRKILRAGDATETAFKELPPARILHIASHGFFHDRETFGLDATGYEHALVKSGLVLAGANNSGPRAGGADGLLTALEVSGIDLSATDLVVLSSCDSGAGSVTHGQGVLGLRRAFSLAGARSLLLTLWPVDDETTAEVMVDFYRNLTTVAPAAALHQAQVDLIGRIRARDGFVSPHLWAAFILESAAGFTPTGARH